MTRKDYERFAMMMQQLRARASVFQGSKPVMGLDQIEESLADVLAADNPTGFKRGHFLKVCRTIRQEQL